MKTEYLLKDGRTLVFRTAEARDAQALLDFSKRIGGETDYLYLDEHGFPGTVEDEVNYIEAQASSECSVQMLGFIDGVLACDFGVDALTKKRIAHNASIGLSVLREYWHVGVGSAIMSCAIEFAREHGLKKLILSARADNARAIALYERYGFYICGRYASHMCVRGEYFDEVLMEMIL